MSRRKRLLSPDLCLESGVRAAAPSPLDPPTPSSRSIANRIRARRFALVFICLSIFLARAFGQVSHTIQITNDADDGYYNQQDSSGWHADPQYGSGSADLVGSDTGLTTAWTVGYRFPSTGVNSGDTIRSAYLTLWSSDGFASNVTCGSAPCTGVNNTNSTFRVYGVAQDDGPSFSNVSGNTPLSVPYSNSFVDYTTTGPGDDNGSCQGNNFGQNTCTHTIDVTNIVREITSRPGWTNTSAIRFVLESTSSGASSVYAGYEDSSANPAKAATLLVNPPQPTVVSSGGFGTGANGTYPTSYSLGPYVYPGASAIFLMLEDYYNFYNVSIGQPTVSDNCGNTWTILAGPTNLQSINYFMRATVYYVQSPASCPNGDTITVNVPVQEPIFLHFYAVAASSTSQAPVVSAVATSPTEIYTTSATTNSATLAGTGQLLSWIIGDSDARTTFTPQAGFVTDINSPPTYITAASENVSAAGTYTNTWSISPSDGWETVLVGLPAASGSGAAAATVTVSASPTTINQTQQLAVTVTVSGTPTPTGSVTLTGGGYTSAATVLSGGVATINIPAGTLTLGVDGLTASYTPDSGSSSIYSGGTGTTSVTVTQATTPGITVSASPSSINPTQGVAVTVTLLGTPTPTGSVVLTSGGYTSPSTPLTAGNAIISIPAGSLGAGTDTVTATYTPDSNSYSTYGGATGTTSVTVTTITPSVTVTPSPSSVTTAQPFGVTVSVSGGNGNPTATGSVILSSGGYTSGATVLTGGAATINVPAGSLSTGSDTLNVSYTPDSNCSTTYSSATGTNSVSITIATPTVTVTPSSNSITTTQALPVTVTVSGGAGSPTATGSVTLSGGSYTSAATALSGGTASINIPAGTLTAANYTFKATYTPDGGSSSIYATASGTASGAVIVGVATPTVTVTPSLSSITTTQALSVTVAVSGGGGNPTATGSVTLSGGGFTSGATVLTGGAATINIPAGSLSAGTDTLSVSYTPDSNSSTIYSNATGTNSVSVTIATPTVTVTPSSFSITTAQALSVTVTVAGTPTPTGSVTLSTGSYTSLATTLSGGLATINIPAGTLPSGSYTFHATYTPDAGSSSIYSGASGVASAAVTVGVATPTVTVTPSLSSITTTQSLSVMVTVSGGAGSPTGSVTLSGGSYTSVVTALSGGVATINIPAGTLPAGSYTFKATYTPDAGSSSIYSSASGTASAAVAVGVVTPTVTVTPSSNSITVAQPLTVTVTVAGTPTPTGSVTLSGGSYTSVATALSSGIATIIIPGGTLPSGSYTFHATYTPDAGSSSIYSGASGTASVPVAVGLATPAVTVTPASTTLNATASLNVTVAVAGSSTIHTGTITLSGGGYAATTETIGTGPCASASSCVFTIPANTLSAGTDTLTAAYNGDGNYAMASNTAQVTVTVTAPTFSLSQAQIAVTPASALTTGIAPGASATAVVTVSALNGYTGTVSLTCQQNTTTLGGDGTTCSGGGSSAPVNLATCGSNCSVSFTIGTTAPVSAALERPKLPHSNKSGWLGVGSGAILSLLVFCGIPARRRSWRSMLGVLVALAVMGGLSSCTSGSSSGGGGGGQGNPGTTAGSYTYTVAATPTPSVNPPVSPITFQILVN